MERKAFKIIFSFVKIDKKKRQDYYNNSFAVQDALLRFWVKSLFKGVLYLLYPWV